MDTETKAEKSNEVAARIDARSIHNPHYTETALGLGLSRTPSQPLDEEAAYDMLLANYNQRHAANVRYGFSIPCPDVLNMVANYAGSVLDYGAGTGYWGYLLTQMGIQYLGLDDYSWRGATGKLGGAAFEIGTHHQVRRGGLITLQHVQEKQKFDAMLLAWPPGRNPMALFAVRAWTGRYVFYSGEWGTEVTANKRFYELMEAEYVQVDYQPEYCWGGCESAFRVFEKRS